MAHSSTPIPNTSGSGDGHHHVGQRNDTNYRQYGSAQNDFTSNSMTQPMSSTFTNDRGTRRLLRSTSQVVEDFNENSPRPRSSGDMCTAYTPQIVHGSYQSIDQSDAPVEPPPHLVDARIGELKYAELQRDYPPGYAPLEFFRRDWLQDWMHIWWWETSCCIIALGAFLAIVATIRSYESKELPQWRFGLNVNAVIAIWTAVLKAAAGLVVAEGISHLKWIMVLRPQNLSTFVAHDDASRGPLGALKLIFKNRYWEKGFHATAFVSSLGAVITVFILLLDPFSQQIVRTHKCRIEVATASGSIPRTNAHYPNGGPGSLSKNIVPPRFRRATYNGLFSDQATNISFDCATGFCDFKEPYATVAYCSSCSDVTSELNITQYSYPGYRKGTNVSISNTNVTLPNGKKYGRNLTLSRITKVTDTFVRLSSAYDDRDGQVSMIRWNGNKATVDEHQSVKAYRCKIYQCVKEFKAKVEVGQLKEELVEESGDISTNATFMVGAPTHLHSVADSKCLGTPNERRALEILGYSVNDTTPRFFPYLGMLINGTTEQPVYTTAGPEKCPSPEAEAFQSPKLCENGKLTDAARSIVPARCIYNTGTSEHDIIQQALFKPMFSGELWDAPDAEVPIMDTATEAMHALFATGSGEGTLDDVQNALRSMTDTITTHLRQTGNKGFSTPARGTMFTDTTCVEVRWAWLAYAASVVLLLLIFFAWVLVHARAAQTLLQKLCQTQEAAPLMHDFKSSALTTLFHGLDRKSLQDMEGLAATNRQSELKRGTVGVRVTMMVTAQGWKLGRAMTK